MMSPSDEAPFRRYQTVTLRAALSGIELYNQEVACVSTLYTVGLECQYNTQHHSNFVRTGDLVEDMTCTTACHLQPALTVCFGVAFPNGSNTAFLPLRYVLILVLSPNLSLQQSSCPARKVCHILGRSASPAM